MYPTANQLQTLASYLCHELINPVGAAHAGVEFFMETDPNDDETVAMIEKSLATAQARIAVYRCAFGANAGQGKDSAQLANILTNYIALQGGTLCWDVPPGTWDQAEYPRLVASMVLIVATAFVGKGYITLTHRRDAEYTITLEADRIYLQEGCQQILAQGQLPKVLAPRDIPAFWLWQVTRAMGYDITITLKNTHFTLATFSQ